MNGQLHGSVSGRVISAGGRGIDHVVSRGWIPTLAGGLLAVGAPWSPLLTWCGATVLPEPAACRSELRKVENPLCSVVFPGLMNLGFVVSTCLRVVGWLGPIKNEIDRAATPGHTTHPFRIEPTNLGYRQEIFECYCCYFSWDFGVG